MKAIVWFSKVTKADAYRLCRWWNGHSIRYQFTVERSSKNSRYFDVIAHPNPEQ